MSFNFETVERAHLGNAVPEGTVRVSTKTVSMAQDVANRFIGTEMKLPSGGRTRRVTLAYDVYNQAIRVSSPTAENKGFVMSISEPGSGSLFMPTKLRGKLPVGDYKLVNGEHDIYQLAR